VVVEVADLGDQTDFLRYAYSVNGGTAVPFQAPPSGGGHVVLSIPVKLTLKSGANTLRLGSSGTSRVSSHHLSYYANKNRLCTGPG
jgi:hypothetical protein